LQEKDILTPDSIGSQTMSENNTPNAVLEFTFEDTNKDKSGRILRAHLVDYATKRDLYITEAQRIFADRLEAKNMGILYKSRVLFTLLHFNDGDVFESLYEYLEISDVSKACEMLDAPRRFRQLQRKLEKDPASKKLATIQKQHVYTMTDVLSLSTEYTFSFNMTRVEKIRRWTRKIPLSKLEYMAMMFDTSHWKKLADLCHFHPKYDFAGEWFMRFCFGTPIGEDNIVSAYQRLNLNSFHEIYEKYYSPDFTYEIIRTKIDLKQRVRGSYSWSGYSTVTDTPEITTLKDRIRETVIQKEGLKTVLWYWDELVTSRNIHSIVCRLKEVEDVDLSYGKVADIISKTDDAEVLSELVSLATKKSDEFRLDADCKDRVCPVAVLCDASSSMEIAIKTSSIITSLLTCATDASLDVFGSENLHIENPPRTVEEGVKFGKEMKTMGCTNCASSIGHYYDRKQVVNTFIIVTDEGENRSHNSMRFDDVYLKYIEEVNPANMIFISFTDPNNDGLMVRNLRKRMDPDLFASLVSVYKFDVNNPDMNRMDLVLRDLARM
jgi:hypothetical protein